MPASSSLRPLALALSLLSSAALVSAQAACYWAAGPQYRIPESVGVVPCQNNGYSTCCRLGDLCLEGNACYSFDYGDTYQYGCSDPTYKDPSCPFKCGWNPDLSPWVALEFCPSFNGIESTWSCQSPESCLCTWWSTYGLLHLPPRECQAYGSLARVAIYASTYSSNLPAYASLPASVGGSTGYYSPGGPTTPLAGYTPASPGPTGTLKVAEKIVVYDTNATPGTSLGSALNSQGSLPPYPTTPTNTAPSSNVLGGSGSVSYSQLTTSSTVTSGPAKTSSSSTTSSTGSSGGGGGGLTTGAKVGLGVGIAGGVCLIAAIVLAAMVVRKRRKKRIEEATVYNDKTHDSAAYYDPYNRGANVHEAQYTPQEEATARKRMSPNGIIAELDSGQHVYEMDSTNGSTTNSPAIGSSTSPRLT